jgi:hypothetical protein
MRLWQHSKRNGESRSNTCNLDKQALPEVLHWWKPRQRECSCDAFDGHSDQ